MEIAIMKTDINTRKDFRMVRNKLLRIYSIRECTIDFEDVDNVVRVVGDKIEIDDIVDRIKNLGFFCEELQ